MISPNIVYGTYVVIDLIIVGILIQYPTRHHQSGEFLFTLIQGVLGKRFALGLVEQFLFFTRYRESQS